MELIRLSKADKLKKARFFVSSMQERLDALKSENYNYAQRNEEYVRKVGWKYIQVNNHSKIILMRTKHNYYVLETSSNLNENPKIEQYSFENSEELYKFYYCFWDKVETAKGDVRNAAEPGCNRKIYKGQQGKSRRKAQDAGKP